MVSPDNPRVIENSLSPQAFAKYYDGRPLDEVAAELEDQLLARPGWKVDGNVLSQVWQKIFGWIIPLMPIEGGVGEEAREFLARKEDKYGPVLPIMVRMPAVDGQQWDSGYIKLADLEKTASVLERELEAAVANFLSQESNGSYQEKWWQWATISMFKLALLAKTPLEELNNPNLVRTLAILANSSG